MGRGSTLDEEARLSIELSAFVAGSAALRLQSAATLSDAEPDARNTLAEPERVAPHVNESAVLDASGTLSITLPAVSWTVLTFG